MLSHRFDTILGNIPKNWDSVMLRDVLETHLPGDWGSDRGEHMVKVLRSTNLTNDGPLDLSDVAVRALSETTAKILQPRKGDLLLERSGGGPDQPVGRVGFVERDLDGYAFSNFLHLLRPDPSRLHPRLLAWLLYLVNRTRVVLRLEQQTTQMRNLHFRDYLTIRLPKPPDEEAGEIARILDAADAAIEHTHGVIAKAQRLKRSAIQKMLRLGVRGEKLKNTRLGKLPESWECLQLGEMILEGPTNGLYRPDSDYGNDGTPIVRIDSFDDGLLHGLPSLLRVRLSAVEQSRYALAPDDILINRVNSLSHIGKSAIVPLLGENMVFESNIMRLRLEPNLRPDFLVRVLCSDFAKAHWLARAKPAVNQASINQRDVRELWIPVPEPKEQEQIAKIFRGLHHYRCTLDLLLADYQKLKRGLMQVLLTGHSCVKGRVSAVKQTKPH